MLKPLEDIQKPDRRHMPGGPLDAVIGVSLEHLHADMAALELHSSVPEEVRWQFDTARHAYVYSWFCYDLVTLAEQHAYGALENGLRLRAQAATVQPKGNGLKVLVASARDNGWLNKSEFEVPGMPNRLDLVRVSRSSALIAPAGLVGAAIGVPGQGGGPAAIWETPPASSAEIRFIDHTAWGKRCVRGGQKFVGSGWPSYVGRKNCELEGPYPSAGRAQIHQSKAGLRGQTQST
jgi:hypothetical protein